MMWRTKKNHGRKQPSEGRSTFFQGRIVAMSSSFTECSRVYCQCKRLPAGIAWALYCVFKEIQEVLGTRVGVLEGVGEKKAVKR